MGEGGAAGENRPPLPAHGWTLVQLGRTAARLGDARRAAECFRSVKPPLIRPNVRGGSFRVRFTEGRRSRRWQR
jgi:hypothetical protein